MPGSKVPPEGLRELMKGLTKEVLREKPLNIYEFSAKYFESRLKEEETELSGERYNVYATYEAAYQARERNKIPVALVFKIIPERLTSLIKDFCKAVLRERPDNICEFAVKYFRELDKAHLQTDGIEYTDFENYFKNPDRYKSYVRCSCGRTIGEVVLPTPKIVENKRCTEVPSTRKEGGHNQRNDFIERKNLAQPDSSSFSTEDRNANQNVKETKSIGNNNSSNCESPFPEPLSSVVGHKTVPNNNEVYFNAVLVIQRFFKRLIKKKRSKGETICAKGESVRTQMKAPPMSFDAAAAIIQRTLSKICTEKLSRKQNNFTSTAASLDNQILHSEEQNDNNSEAASYSSATTMRMSAGSGVGVDVAVQETQSVEDSRIEIAAESVDRRPAATKNNENDDLLDIVSNTTELNSEGVKQTEISKNQDSENLENVSIADKQNQNNLKEAAETLASEEVISTNPGPTEVNDNGEEAEKLLKVKENQQDADWSTLANRIYSVPIAIAAIDLLQHSVMNSKNIGNLENVKDEAGTQKEQSQVSERSETPEVVKGSKGNGAVVAVAAPELYENRSQHQKDDETATDTSHRYQKLKDAGTAGITDNNQASCSEINETAPSAISVEDLSYRERSQSTEDQLERSKSQSDQRDLENSQDLKNMEVRKNPEELKVVKALETHEDVYQNERETNISKDIEESQQIRDDEDGLTNVSVSQEKEKIEATEIERSPSQTEETENNTTQSEKDKPLQDAEAEDTFEVNTSDNISQNNSEDIDPSGSSESQVDQPLAVSDRIKDALETQGSETQTHDLSHVKNQSSINNNESHNVNDDITSVVMTDNREVIKPVKTIGIQPGYEKPGQNQQQTNPNDEIAGEIHEGPPDVLNNENMDSKGLEVQCVDVKKDERNDSQHDQTSEAPMEDKSRTNISSAQTSLELSLREGEDKVGTAVDCAETIENESSLVLSDRIVTENDQTLPQKGDNSSHKHIEKVPENAALTVEGSSITYSGEEKQVQNHVSLGHQHDLLPTTIKTLENISEETHFTSLEQEEHTLEQHENDTLKETQFPEKQATKTENTHNYSERTATYLYGIHTPRQSPAAGKSSLEETASGSTFKERETKPKRRHQIDKKKLLGNECRGRQTTDLPCTATEKLSPEKALPSKTSGDCHNNEISAGENAKEVEHVASKIATELQSEIRQDDGSVVPVNDSSGSSSDNDSEVTSSWTCSKETDENVSSDEFNLHESANETAHYKPQRLDVTHSCEPKQGGIYEMSPNSNILLTETKLSSQELQEAHRSDEPQFPKSQNNNEMKRNSQTSDIDLVINEIPSNESNSVCTEGPEEKISFERNANDVEPPAEIIEQYINHVVKCSTTNVDVLEINDGSEPDRNGAQGCRVQSAERKTNVLNEFDAAPNSASPESFDFVEEAIAELKDATIELGKFLDTYSGAQSARPPGNENNKHIRNEINSEVPSSTELKAPSSASVELSEDNEEENSENSEQNSLQIASNVNKKSHEASELTQNHLQSDVLKACLLEDKDSTENNKDNFDEETENTFGFLTEANLPTNKSESSAELSSKDNAELPKVNWFVGEEPIESSAISSSAKSNEFSKVIKADEAYVEALNSLATTVTENNSLGKSVSFAEPDNGEKIVMDNNEHPQIQSTKPEKECSKSNIPYEKLRESSTISIHSESNDDFSEEQNEQIQATRNSESKHDGADSLEAKAAKLRDAEIVIEKMQQRRASETRSGSIDERLSQEAGTFDDPVIKSMTELEKSGQSNTQMKEDSVVVLKSLQTDTRESSVQSTRNSSALGESDQDGDKTGNMECNEAHNITNCSKNTYEMTVNNSGKVASKSVKIDDTIKYIEPLEAEATTTTTNSESSFCFNDGTSEQKAGTLHESDSELTTALNSNKPNRSNDEFRPTSILARNSSTSAIVSAVIKIQATARGFLTRRRLKHFRLSTQHDATSSSDTVVVGMPFGNLIEGGATEEKHGVDLPTDQEISSSDNLNARRNTLRRRDALQKDSTPEEVNIDSFDSTTLALKVSTSDNKDTLIASRNSESAASAPVHSKKAAIDFKWFALRQNSMPVQIESEIFRVIPKHMRKRVKSAEDGKGKGKGRKAAARTVREIEWRN